MKVRMDKKRLEISTPETNKSTRGASSKLGVGYRTPGRQQQYSRVLPGTTRSPRLTSSITERR
eukprot:scaffold285059_cov41-Prasinocladus_malaysianus.AAC.1